VLDDWATLVEGRASVLADIWDESVTKHQQEFLLQDHTSAERDVTLPRRLSSRELDRNADSAPLLTTLLNHVPRWLSLNI
jgi:hypothetical protein